MESNITAASEKMQRQQCRNGATCKWLKQGTCRFSHEPPKADKLLHGHDVDWWKEIGKMDMEGEEYEKYCHAVDKEARENYLCLLLHIAAERKAREIEKELNEEKILDSI